MSIKFTPGNTGTKQSFKLNVKSVEHGGIDITTETHASIPFMVEALSEVLYRLTLSFNRSPDILCKNAFWLMIREKVDEKVKEGKEDA